MSSSLFFFNDTATTEIYTLSLHDALPILLAQSEIGEVSEGGPAEARDKDPQAPAASPRRGGSSAMPDRKSTRLNSSHTVISYAVFCLKKKKREQSAGGLITNLTRRTLSEV